MATDSSSSNPKEGASPLDRAAIIRATTTPLGFFSLVVLVVEAIFGVVAGLSSGVDRTVTVVAMVVLIVSLVGIVAYFARYWPEALQGIRREVREEPLESIKIEKVFCGVTAEYGDLGFKGDIDIIRKEFCNNVIEEHQLTGAKIQEHLTREHFTVVHLLGFVDSSTGEFRFSEHERISAQGLAKLVEVCGARLVFLATCDSLLLAAKLAPRANVVAASGTVGIEKFLSWDRTFYRLLGSAKPLSEAYDVARAMSDSPLVLLMKKDLQFRA